MEKKVALVTGADRGFGLHIVKKLAQQGWYVFAGRVLQEYNLLENLKKDYPQVYPIQLDVTNEQDIQSVKQEIEQTCGKLDLLVSNAAYMRGPITSTIGGENPIDFALLEKAFCINSLAGVILVDRLLPLLEKGEMKRLFFTSSEISSLKLMIRVGEMRYAMTKTALNLGVRMLFNTLRPKGYTFRLYQPGGMKRVLPDGSFEKNQATVDPEISAQEAVRQILEDRLDEDRLALIDYHGRELSF